MYSQKNYYDTLENPYLIDIEDKLEYSNEELNNIQKLLKDKYIDYIIEEEFNENFKWSFSWVRDRCAKGLTMTIIDLSNNILPTKNLFKIGDGGDSKNCFVCYSSLNTDRNDFSKTMVQSLEEVGFNGHFYLFNGGFPNPTGTEMKFVGVPYSFKIFMMLEAQKKGFEKVIWLDAACYAVNNPQRLFDILKEDDAIFNLIYPHVLEPDPNIDFYDLVVLPSTIKLMTKLMGRNIKEDINVNSVVFGLNLCSSKIQNFIKEYYELVKIGLPFLSTFPEEFVFASIFNKPEYKYVFNYNRCEIDKLYINEHYLNKLQSKEHGFYFLQRRYN